MAVTALCCLSLVAAPSAGNDDQLALDTLRAKLKRLERHLVDKQNQRDDQQIRLLDLEKTIKTLERKKSDTDREFARIAARQRQLDKQFEAGQRSLDTQRQSIRRWSQSGYALGKQSFIKLILSQDDPSTLARMVTYYGYLTRTQASEIAELTNRLSEMTSVAADLEITGETLRRLNQAQQDNARALTKKRAEREAMVTLLNTDIEDRLTKVKRLRSDERRLMKLVKTVQQSDNRATQAETAAKAGTFGNLKGRLKLPLDAELAARFGQSRPNGGLRWDGVLLDAPEGSDFHAVADGTVVYADWFRGFGLLLIVDHGDGFMTLYSHGDEISKSLGDPVSAGEVLGKVGVTGGLSTPGLYFEIRRNGRPQDPLIWCKA